ncbi:MAG: serine/threonine protein kinase [Verrucomicrobia bacterium]|nr:serine/threonine protein kinase [Verrucomicrobiota bacterium]
MEAPLNDPSSELAEIVKSALEVPADGRGAFLDARCEGNAELRREVESLLAQEGSARELMQEAAHAKLAGILGESESELSPGEQLGNYTIVSLIGEGGMGEVYLAQDKSLGRQVAIKLLKPGLGTASIIRRFHEEERLLAGLVHPNIAQLFSAGLTSGGLPYFVMEYVDGPRLDDYCREKALSIFQRLELFRQICGAVSYAHRRLVIHRDLKAANIRVTGSGEPKLLDFGIAKLFDPSSALPEVTMTFASVMTPEYASPEQVRGEPVTTATDIYSLGVLLYELLTGEKPYKLDKHNPAAIAKAITETEPTKPSLALGRDRTADTKARTLLRGDLDNIILKALRKEPERRYQTVPQFSDDIGRYLEGRPVVARKSTARYRAGKFISRHKAGVAATAAVLIALIAATIISAWQARIARMEKGKAERRFNDIRQMAESFMFDVHDSIKNLAGSTPARQLLVSRALGYLDGLAREAHGDATLQSELATAYEKLGDIQGNPYVSNLGDTKGAYQSYTKALTMRQSLARIHPGNEAQEQLAKTYRAMGDILDQKGDVAGSVGSYRKSLGIFESLSSANPGNPHFAEELARAYDALGDGLRKTDHLEERMACFRKEAAMWQHLLDGDPENRRVQRSVAVSLMKLGDGWRDNKQEALDSLRKSVAIAQSLAASDPANASAQRDFALISYRLGEVLTQTGDYAAALQELPKPLTIYEKLAAADTKDVQARFDAASIHEDMAEASVNSGDPGRAVTEGTTALATFRQLVHNDAANMIYLRNLGLCYETLGNAHALAATRNIPAPERVARWTEARDDYRMAAETVATLVRRGALRPADKNLPTELAAKLANCDQNIVRVTQSSGATAR